MHEDALLKVFIQFGLAGLLGFLIGLEREHTIAEDSARGNYHLGVRDFVLFALLGATSAFTAVKWDNAWILIAGFFGFLSILISGYWADQNEDEDAGFTTEASAIMTFFLGVLMIADAREIAVALAIVTIGILYQRQAIKSFTSKIQHTEIQAAFKFLTITFIILPILPNQSMDTYLANNIGTVTSVDSIQGTLNIHLEGTHRVELNENTLIFTKNGKFVGKANVITIAHNEVVAKFLDKTIANVKADFQARQEFSVEFVSIMMSPLNPYKIWLIVVLVSLVSFVGYILIKVLGSAAGIGLTGLVGGLVSSTVTTLSFAKRSKEHPEMNEKFAVAIILAGSIMFPRLLLEIGVVNQELMKKMALPILMMGGVGLLLSLFYFVRSKHDEKPQESVSFQNPFNLRSAISFAAVFGLILMITRLATTYLGSAWLPVVAIVSGLTDADAIAFSISDAQQAGTLSLDWASFNLVLGALSNTFMKLFLVFSFGNIGLFKKLLSSFCIIGASGIITMFFYYDFNTVSF
ncbi:MgtC/SapB family protein [Deltaproteobacteria bacterium TL4]